jgi:hypothetical protein
MTWWMKFDELMNREWNPESFREWLMNKKWLKKMDNNLVDCDQENQQTWGMIRSCICHLEIEGHRRLDMFDQRSGFHVMKRKWSPSVYGSIKCHQEIATLHVDIQWEALTPTNRFEKWIQLHCSGVLPSGYLTYIWKSTVFNNANHNIYHQTNWGHLYHSYIRLYLKITRG